MALRRSRIKMQFSWLHFKHPNILRTLDELSRWNFFLGSIISGVLGVVDSRKKFDRESSSEVRKMFGRLKCNYENCIFIRERLHCKWQKYNKF